MMCRVVLVAACALVAPALVVGSEQQRVTDPGGVGSSASGGGLLKHSQPTETRELVCSDGASDPHFGCCSNTPDFGQKIEIHLYITPPNLVGKKLQAEGFPVVFPPENENNTHQPVGPNVYALQDPARPECGLPDPNNSEGLVFNADQNTFEPGQDEVMHFKAAEGTRLCVQRVGLSVGYNDATDGMGNPDPGFATLEAYDVDGNLLGCVETIFDCTPPEFNNCFEFMELEFVDQFDNPAIHAIRVSDTDASGVAVNCITFSEPCLCDTEDACGPLPVASKSWSLVKELYH